MGNISAERHRVRDNSMVRVHTAEPCDAAGVLELIGQLLASGVDAREPGEHAQDVEQTREWILDGQRNPGRLVLVAEIHGIPVGFLAFGTGEFKRIAHRGFISLCVAETWRRWGIGTLLLQAFLRWAEREPVVEKVCAIILATNQASLTLYQQCGFIEEGRRKGEYRIAPDTYVDEVYMSRFVRADDGPEPRPSSGLH